MNDLQEIGKLRRAMMPLFKMLPDSLIEANERRFGLLEKKLEELALQKPEVIIHPPDVNVPKIDAPSVTVNVDVDTIAAAIEKSTTSVLAKAKSSETPSQYEPHDQAKTQPYTYSGFVRPDGGWYIQRVAKGEQRYTKGSSGYRTAWDKRSKLKYGDIDA